MRRKLTAEERRRLRLLVDARRRELLVGGCVHRYDGRNGPRIRLSDVRVPLVPLGIDRRAA